MLAALPAVGGGVGLSGGELGLLEAAGRHRHRAEGGREQLEQELEDLEKGTSQLGGSHFFCKKKLEKN